MLHDASEHQTDLVIGSSSALSYSAPQGELSLTLGRFAVLSLFLIMNRYLAGHHFSLYDITCVPTCEILFYTFFRTYLTTCSNEASSVLLLPRALCIGCFG